MSAEPQEKPTFDPARHMGKVSGRDYLEVKWRLVWFHDRHPNGSIVTDMIQHANNSAVFKASVSWPSDDGIAIRTGYGSEKSDDFGDYLEKAETKAIGRALAAAGFGTQFCDDHAFGADQQRVVDSPTDIRTARPRSNQQPSATQEATPRQVKYLYAVAREVGISNDDLEERSQDGFGCTISELSRRDVSALIEQIQAGRPVHAAAHTDAKASAVAAQAPMPAQQTTGSLGPITSAQKNIIKNLLDPDMAEEVAQRMFKQSVSRLTTEQAQDLMDVERRAEAARN